MPLPLISILPLVSNEAGSPSGHKDEFIKQTMKSEPSRTHMIKASGRVRSPLREAEVNCWDVDGEVILFVLKILF